MDDVGDDAGEEVNVLLSTHGPGFTWQTTVRAKACWRAPAAEGEVGGPHGRHRGQ